MHVSGSRVLLTGATGGLGQAMARLLHRLGAHLVLSGRNVTQLEALAGEIDATVRVADLCDPAAVDALTEGFSDIDVLIANAGAGGELSLADDTSANIDRVLDLNLRAPMQLATRFAQQRLESRANGHIVLIGSLSGLAASPNTRLYNATKFGLRGFALALRQDLAGTGVGVSIVEPGFIRDAGMFADSGVRLPKIVRTESPEDVARAVVGAIEHDRGEVFVAPVELRASATLAALAPGASERLQRLAGAADITARRDR